MRKLVFVLVGLFALFTLIKAYTSVRAESDASLHEQPIQTSQSSTSAVHK